MDIHTDVINQQYHSSTVYVLQAARDRYRDLTAVTTGMNWELINKFIKVITMFSTLYS